MEAIEELVVLIDKYCFILNNMDGSNTDRPRIVTIIRELSAVLEMLEKELIV